MLTSGTILQSRYRIVRKLSAGGMGTVYEAIDLRFNGQVAIKETHFTDEALRKQFEREAHLLYQLRHPAIARVIDQFADDSGQFLVMDYVDGADLLERLEKHPAGFAVESVLSWADQLLDALSYLHAQTPPIVHRDIKPQNLKLTSDGRIILLDFGLAKGFAGQVSRLANSGSIFGYTPSYAPLEQIQGEGTNAQSDFYSLSATLYHLLTGTIPPDALKRVSAVTDGDPDPLRPADEIEPQIGTRLTHALMRGMAISRKKRFASAEEMRLALGAERERPPPIAYQPTVTSSTGGEPAEGQVMPVTGVAPTVASPLPRGNAQAATVGSIDRGELLSPLSATVAAETRLSSPDRTAPPPAYTRVTSDVTPQPASKNKLLPLAIAGIALLVLAGIIGFVLLRNRGGNAESPSSNRTPPSGTPIVSGAPPIRAPALLKPGELLVGTDATYPPFESVEGDQFSGFDIDIAMAIAREMALTPRFVNVSFDGIFTALANGMFDIVMSAVTITPERQAVMLFAPYYNSGEMICVRNDTKGIQTPDDLRGKTVGVQVNTTAQYVLEKRDGITVRTYNTVDQALQDLTSGRIDAVASDAPVLKFLIFKSFPGLKTVGPRFTDERFGIGVRKGHEDTVLAINQALERIRFSGEYDRVHKKWFGTAE